MPLDNAQAEFGIRAFLEGPSDGVGDERTVASENRTFYDEVSAVTLPALSPRVQTLQGFVSIEEVVGYDVTRFTFTVSTFRPELVRNAGKDDIIIATDAEGTVAARGRPYFRLSGLLRDASGGRTRRIALYAEGRFEVVPQQQSREGVAGGGGIVVNQACTKAGIWYVGTVAEGDDADLASIADPANASAALWFIDAAAGELWRNGENVVQSYRSLLGLGS